MWTLDYNIEDVPKIKSEPRLLSVFSKDCRDVIQRACSTSNLNFNTNSILIIQIPIQPTRVYTLDRPPDTVVRRIKPANAQTRVKNFIRRSKALTIHEDTMSYVTEPLPGTFVPNEETGCSGKRNGSRNPPGKSTSLVNLLTLSPEPQHRDRTFGVSQTRRKRRDKPNSLVNLLTFMKNKWSYNYYLVGK